MKCENKPVREEDEKMRLNTWEKTVSINKMGDWSNDGSHNRKETKTESVNGQNPEGKGRT